MLAIAESPSQSRPGSVVTTNDSINVPKSGKRERPQSLKTPNEIEPKNLKEGQPAKGKTPSTTFVDANTKSKAQSDVLAKKNPPNLVLPSFQNTYKVRDKPSFIQQLSRLLQYTRLPDTKHVNRLQEPPKIRHALAIVRSPTVTPAVLTVPNSK